MQPPSRLRPRAFRFTPGALATALTVLGCGIASGDLVQDWNEAALDAVRTDRTNPPRASRGFAMTHLAIYDALNGIERTHRPYLVNDLAPTGASKEAAIAAAARKVLTALHTNPDTQAAHITPLYDATLAGIADGPAKTDGLAWGELVADAILALRAGDGWDVPGQYTTVDEPGRWKPTPPAFAPSPLLPAWGEVTPFTMTSGGQFRPQTPPPLNTAAYSFEFNVVKMYGGTTSTLRTEDQSEVAEFWADGVGTATPPGHWNMIAQDVGEAQGLSLAENARLFALINMAMADAGIAAWDCKYVYDYWRPVTAIREAETDGHPETEADPDWTSFVVTPPFPEYTSGHSTFSRSGATVMAAFFGTDEIEFTTTTDSMPGVTRTYQSFGRAADDAGISRIYGGIHWPSANLLGQACGRDIGLQVADYFLRPFNEPAFTAIRRVGGSTQLEFIGDADRMYTIRATSDMETWEDIAVLSSPSGLIQFEDVNAPMDRVRFYQAVAHGGE